MTKITDKKLLDVLSAVAFSDFTDYVHIDPGENGPVLTVNTTEGLSRPKRLAVAAIKAGTKGIEVKLYDRLKAVEMLARFTGLFADKGEEPSLDALMAALEEAEGDNAD